MATLAALSDFESAGIPLAQWADATRDARVLPYETWRDHYCVHVTGQPDDIFELHALAVYEDGPLMWWLACRRN